MQFETRADVVKHIREKVGCSMQEASDLVRAIERNCVTLRDSFASAVMTGWMSTSPEINGERVRSTKEHAAMMANAAYLFADAMLEARVLEQ